MKIDLQNMLYERYPNLYKQHKLDMTQTCMCWGICTGNGWFNLIDDLSSKLEPLGVEAVQVKEKFGILSFYLDRYNIKAIELVNEAAERSYKICEVCGKDGELRKDLSWIRTLCEDCYSDIIKWR
jgi:hypothetical protein